MAARAFEQAVADVRRGWSAPAEDILIAALVVLPFAATLGILLQAAGLPGPAAVVVAGVAQGVATFWNAGWRARGEE